MLGIHVKLGWLVHVWRGNRAEMGFEPASLVGVLNFEGPWGFDQWT